MSIFSDLTPADLSLPDKFTAFRSEQCEAAEYVIYDTSKRFCAICLPTGSGKTLTAAMIAQATGLKTVYLTATRGVEDQAVRDFASCGMVDIRGRQNYDCKELYIGGSYREARARMNPTCQYGHDHECRYEFTSDCPHTCAVAAAEQASFVSSNYSCWMHSRKYNEDAFASPERPVELLICDEAGALPDLVADFVAIKINDSDEDLPYQYQARAKAQPGGVMPNETWTTFAQERRRQASEEAMRIRASYVTKDAAMHDDRYAYLQELIEKCDRIPKLNANWVWEMDREGVKFTPIRPGAFASCVWSNVPRIVLMSATLRPYTLSLLGIGKEDYDYREWKTSFPPQYGPVYHLSAGVKLTWKSSDEDFAKVVERMDEIIDSRPGRRVLVHTVAYHRQRSVLNRSRHASRMIFNEDGRDANGAAQRFRSGPNDAILISPSFSTGFDFPDEQCEVNIILKVPYPNSASWVGKMRCQDPEYRMHATVQELVQMCGRPRRHARDRAECVSPSTNILTADLKWKQAVSLSVGDVLVGFDEYGYGREDPRRLRWATVIKAVTRTMPRVRLIHEEGEIICTPNHPWVTQKKQGRTIQWRETIDLKKGDKLFRILDPWRELDDRKSGWLAGIYDGEGCLVFGHGKRNPRVGGVYCVQNRGLVADEIAVLLEGFGFRYTIMPRPGEGTCIKLRGGLQEWLRFLGQVRPIRLLDKFRRHTSRGERLQAIRYPRVLCVERLKDGDITSLQTSTGTYIADGFGAHNTFILDDGIKWVQGSPRNPWHGHAPAGFQVHEISRVPAAPPRASSSINTLTSTGS